MASAAPQGRLGVTDNAAPQESYARRTHAVHLVAVLAAPLIKPVLMISAALQEQ